MAEPRVPSASAHPQQDLQRIARNLRLRLEGEARAGLAALPRAGLAALPRAGGQAAAAASAPDAHGASPEKRAAEAVRRELARRTEDAGADDVVETEPADEAPPPVVHVAGPGLFDMASPDLDGGLTREEALGRIVAEVAACDRCPALVAHRTHTVPGQGNPYAKLVFIGEGPGEEEDRQGLAFVGRAGQLLTKMIESIRLTREEVFIANILKCRPPQNRQPQPDEAANCAPYLARQLEILRPKVIVALGGTAAQHLLQTHDGITRLRGRFYPYMGAQLMPTFHPAYVLRNYTPDTRKKVYDDLLKVRAALDA